MLGHGEEALLHHQSTRLGFFLQACTVGRGGFLRLQNRLGQLRVVGVSVEKCTSCLFSFLGLLRLLLERRSEALEKAGSTVGRGSSTRAQRC